MRYTYLGDRLTDDNLRGMQCDPVLRPNGKCYTSKMSTILVHDANGRKYMVMRRMLRRNDKLKGSEGGIKPPCC